MNALLTSYAFRKSEGPRASGNLWLYFHFLLLFEVNASVPLPFVAACEAFAAHVTGEGLLPGVSPGVGREVVAAAKAAQTDAALEGLMARVNADVAVELVRA